MAVVVEGIAVGDLRVNTADRKVHLREPPKEEMPSEPPALPDLASIQDGTELTTDQIDELFQADSLGASSAMRDKTLVIKGMVNKVFIRDHLDVRYLMLSDPGEDIIFQSPQLTMSV